MTAAFGEEASYAPINLLFAGGGVRVMAEQFRAKRVKNAVEGRSLVFSSRGREVQVTGSNQSDNANHGFRYEDLGNLSDFNSNGQD